MWLSGRQTPDFRTIALFRKDRLMDFKTVFPHVVELCMELGMARVGTIACCRRRIRNQEQLPIPQTPKDHWFIPYQNYNRDIVLRNKGLYTIPKTPDVELEKYKARMFIRLRSEEGERMMKRRREDVEPVFGDIKEHMKFRRFTLQGKAKCLVELGILSFTHNIKKIRTFIQKSIKHDIITEDIAKWGQVLGYVHS